jgi:hypothetical protein
MAPIFKHVNNKQMKIILSKFLFAIFVSGLLFLGGVAGYFLSEATAEHPEAPKIKIPTTCSHFQSEENFREQLFQAHNLLFMQCGRHFFTTGADSVIMYEMDQLWSIDDYEVMFKGARQNPPK